MSFFGDKNIPTAGPDTKIAIVISEFNETIGEKLLDSCIKTLKSGGVFLENIEVIWVPGAFEIPLMTQKVAVAQNIDAIITLGAVIRGDTPHFDYVCSGCTKGIMDVQLKTQIPIIFGVLTCDNPKQAIARSSNDKNNKGYQCAIATIEMVNLMNAV